MRTRFCGRYFLLPISYFLSPTQYTKNSAFYRAGDSDLSKPSFDYRYRFLIHALIYVLGFWSPWLLWTRLAGIPFFTDNTTWLVLASLLSRTGLLTFFAAVDVLLVISLVLLAFGAWMRTWGSAYVTTTVVRARVMQGETMLADGPYRHTRNPLYLGTLLHTIGIAIVMPPSGAILAITLLWIFQVRLALAEEPFLVKRFGQPYLEYKARVPRFLPTLAAMVPPAGQQPQWLQAMLGEFYFLGAFLVLAIFGWKFNANPVRQGILITLGVWLIIRALIPAAKSPESQAI